MTTEKLLRLKDCVEKLNEQGLAQTSLSLFYSDTLFSLESRLPEAKLIRKIGGKLGKFLYFSFGPASVSYFVSLSSPWEKASYLTGIDTLLEFLYLGKDPSTNLTFIKELSEAMWTRASGDDAVVVLPPLPGSEDITSSYGLVYDRLFNWGFRTKLLLSDDSSTRRAYWPLFHPSDQKYASESGIRIPCYTGIQTYFSITNPDLLHFIVFWRSLELFNFANDLYSFTYLFYKFASTFSTEALVKNILITHQIGNFHYVDSPPSK